MNMNSMSMDMKDRIPPPLATASHRSKDVAPFLKNLRAMLESESPAILRWTSDGRAFEILDLEQMSDHVLPKYFKHAKYTSFQRQLNYFNFRKWTKSKAEVCTFSNAFFVRDQPSLSGHISRKKSVPSHLKVLSVKARRPKRKQQQQQLEEYQPACSQSHSEVTIKLPGAAAMDVTSVDRLSFASPTEVYSSELAFPPLEYDDPYYSSHSSSSASDAFASIELDWVDTLYSSLNGVSTAPPLYFDPSDASCFDLRL